MRILYKIKVSKLKLEVSLTIYFSCCLPLSTPPTQTSTTHTATHTPRHRRCDGSRRSLRSCIYLMCRDMKYKIVNLWCQALYLE